MGMISAQIDDEILQDFRKIIFLKYGLRKGDLKKTLEEAMKDYIKKHSDLQQKIDNPSSDSHKS